MWGGENVRYSFKTIVPSKVTHLIHSPIGEQSSLALNHKSTADTRGPLATRCSLRTRTRAHRHRHTRARTHARATAMRHGARHGEMKTRERQGAHVLALLSLCLAQSPASCWPKLRPLICQGQKVGGVSQPIREVHFAVTVRRMLRGPRSCDEGAWETDDGGECVRCWIIFLVFIG